MKIWYLESDASLHRKMMDAFSREDVEVTFFDAVYRMNQALKVDTPDLFILDLSIENIESLSKISHQDFPMIIVTEKNQKYNYAMKKTNVDFIVKPFHPSELVSRVLAYAKREHNRIIHYGPFELNLNLRELKVNHSIIPLTNKEFEIVRLFLSCPGFSFTRDRMFLQVWQEEYMTYSRTIDMHIRTIRRKLGSYGKCIMTVRNVGYRLEA